MGLSGRHEDRLARHPAQDRGRRRDRRRRERRGREPGLRHDPREREEVQGRREDRRRPGAADDTGLEIPAQVWLRLSSASDASAEWIAQP